jgi:DUF971 family protein
MSADLRVLPRTVEPIGEGYLGIVWADGHESVYEAERLRDACPCAACLERRGAAPAGAARPALALPVAGQQGPGSAARLERVDPVGRYALRLAFGDRHDTGIYTFELLRALCPCERCAAAR